MLERYVILEKASLCRTYLELCAALNTTYFKLIPMLKTYNIVKEVREKFKNCRLLDHRWRTDKYTEKKMIGLAGDSTSLNMMGKKLGITRERVRQIINILGFNEKILLILRNNRNA